MRVTDPDPSPPVEQASPPQQPGTRRKSASSASLWRPAGLVALIIVLAIAVFATTFLSRNGSLYGGHLTGTGPNTPRIPSSVYMIANHTLYAIGASNGAQRWQISADDAFTPDPIVAHGIIYTTGIPNSFVMARRASDGATLWSKLIIRAEGKHIVLAGDTLYMTTDMIGGEVLAPGYVHGVYALWASDGAIRWHHDTTDPVISPPLAVDGVIYAGVGASLVALRASDGAQLWQRPLAVRGRPYLPLWLASSAGTIYTYGRDQNLDQPYSPANSGDAAVFALQATDGAPRWSRPLDGTEPDQDVSTPVVADGTLYVRSNGNGSQAQARGVPSYGGGLHALRASDGTPLWTYPTAITQPVASDGIVYTSDISGNVIALRGTDGVSIWKLPVGEVATSRQTSLTLANGTLYAASRVAGPTGGDAIVRALRASDGQQRWQCRLSGASDYLLGAPVFAA